MVVGHVLCPRRIQGAEPRLKGNTVSGSNVPPLDSSQLVGSLARLHLSRDLANRVQRIVDALGLNDRVDGLATVVETVLAYLPDPGDHAFHLASGFAEWQETLTELDRVAHSDLNSLNREQFLKQYPREFSILAGLMSEEPNIVQPQGRALKSLLLAGCVARDIASSQGQSLDIPVEDLAIHVRLALEHARDPYTARPLDSSLPGNAVTMRCLRQMGALERPAAMGHLAREMYSRIRQVAERTLHLNSLDLSLSGTGSQRSNVKIAPLPFGDDAQGDFEASKLLVFDDQVDGEPEEVVETVDAHAEGVLISHIGLEQSLQRARFLAGEYAAPAVWSTRGLVPAEQQRLRSLFENLDEFDASQAIVLTLMVVKGQSVADTLTTTIGPTGEVTLQGEYRRSVPELESSTAEKESPVLDLALPALIVRLLGRALPDDVVGNHRLGTLLGITDQQAFVSRLGMLLREKVGHRVQPRHIENALRRAIHARTDNEVITFLLTGRADQVPPVGLHYLSITDDALREAFRSAVVEFFPEVQDS